MMTYTLILDRKDLKGNSRANMLNFSGERKC